jgi:hypothetical protein
MAWDPDRPIPWKRLVRDWVVYAIIMTVVLALVAREKMGPAIGAVLVSLPIYLAIAGVLAKFGYVRKTLAEQRAISEERQAQRAAAKAARGGDATTTARARPAPTRRTSTGPSQRKRSGGRKR